MQGRISPKEKRDGAQLPILGGGVGCEIPRLPESQALKEWGVHSTGLGQGPPDFGLLSPVPGDRYTGRNC